MDILEKAINGGLIFDGAMGSMLIAAGLKGGKVSELWNVERPGVIEEIHRAYFEAGADVATANTFGGSSFKLKRVGVDLDPALINGNAVKNAKKTAEPGQYVAGDMGPLGEMLQPAGLLSFEAAVDYFAEHAGYIEEAGVDCFLLETFFDINEMVAAIKGIRSVSSLPVFSTMTFQKKKKGFFSLMGNGPEESMDKMLEAGASVVGANCSLSSATMVELAEKICKGVDAPVMIQPNAGEPEVRGESVVYPESISCFCDNIMRLKEMGVDVVGGCCGTTPDFIRAVAERIMS